jgi:hypothetical protein
MTYMGKTVEYWRGTELFTVDNWYMQGNTPVGWVQDVNFLGQINITSNTTYLNFQENGATDADFLVIGWETCPEAKCGGGGGSSSSSSEEADALPFSHLTKELFYPNLEL